MAASAVVFTLNEDSSSSDAESETPKPLVNDKAKQMAPSEVTSPLLSPHHSNDNPKSKECSLKRSSVILIPNKAQGFRLPESLSMLSTEDINQRREALRLFSSQQSMNSSVLRSCAVLPGVGISYELTPFSSTLSSLTPLCRICQCPNDPSNILITPCRCDGSLKHIHGTCLQKWIDVCKRKHKYSGPAFCELCGYIYRTHKYFKCKDWRMPRIALRDKILHSMFLITTFLMIGCAVATVMCFTTDQAELTRIKELQGDDKKLTKEELITISCGITFFLSFFLAMAAELKAKHAIHHIFRRFIRHNTVWLIENYNIAYDDERRKRRN